jgi:hypothetical protein
MCCSTDPSHVSGQNLAGVHSKLKLQIPGLFQPDDFRCNFYFINIIIIIIIIIGPRC